jgi:hypothetical protein
MLLGPQKLGILLTAFIAVSGCQKKSDDEESGSDDEVPNEVVSSGEQPDGVDGGSATPPVPTPVPSDPTKPNDGSETPPDSGDNPTISWDAPTQAYTVFWNQDLGLSSSATASNDATIAYTLDLDASTCDDGSFTPSIDAATGAISGTPTGADVGTCSLWVIANITSVSKSKELTLTIRGPVTWSSTIADFSQSEDLPLNSVTADATDPDATDPVSYSIKAAESTCDDGAWSPAIGIDSSTGEISGTPTNGDVGTCQLTVVASSPDSFIEQTIVITVINTNDLPTWAALIGDQSITEDTAVNYTATATDPDLGDSFAYSLDLANMTCDDGSWSPQIAIDNLSGAITGTPTDGDVGSCTVKIDATSGSDTISETITLTVLNDSDLPIWDSLIGDQNTDEDTPISYIASASDADLGDTVAYSLDTDNMTCDDGSWSPTISIDSVSGAITGTPTNGDVGTCTVKIDATSGGDTISESLTLTIYNTNDLPSWNSLIGDQTIGEDGPIGFAASASDEDVGDTISYSLDGDNMTCDDGSWSPGLAIDPVSGALTGTPTNSDVGTCSVIIVATSGVDSISETITLTVTNTADLPVWDSLIGNQIINEDGPISFSASASDADAGDTIVYTLDLANMSCDDGNWSPAIAIDSLNGNLTGTPTNGDVGTCSVKIDATAGGDTISESITLTIANTNDLPTWNTTIGDFSIAQNLSISENAAASDIDVSDTITYSLDAGSMTCDDGAWAPAPSVHSTSGAISGTPHATDVGSCTITVLASDGTASINQTFTVTISPDTTPADNPLSVTNAAYAPTSGTTPTISWSPSASGDIGGYEVAIGVVAGGATIMGWTDVGNVLSKSFSGFSWDECPAQYYVSVRAYDNVGNKQSIGTSSDTTFRFDSTIPGAPTSLVLGDDASESASDNTSWSAAVDNCEIDYYEIAVSTTEDESGIFAGSGWVSDGSNLSGRIDIGITLGVGIPYYTLVRAVDKMGNTGSFAYSQSWQLFDPTVELPNMIVWLDGQSTSDVLDSGGLDADNPSFNGSVATWKDKSGSANVHNFTGSGSNRPTFNQTKKSVSFNGAGQYLTTPNHAEINTATVTQRNITLAFETGSDVNARQVIYEEGGGTRGMNIYIDNGSIYCGFWNVSNDGDGAQAFISVASDPNITADTAYNASIVFDYTNFTGAGGDDGIVTCYVNGANIGSVATTSRLHAHSAAVGLGAKYGTTYYHDGVSNGNGHTFYGDLFEVMIFNDPPDDATISQVHSYLDGKW